MKKLTLTPKLATRLDRLEDKARNLSYIGADMADIDDRPIVAIVGTRKPTPQGKKIVQELAADLARRGVVIVSGNALGTDVLAQESALQANGTVISVLPSGLDNIYPATNRKVAEQIVEQGGTLVSEFNPGHVPMAHDFLQRNRIIAALSDAVLIPEAAARSGSLNTAKHAKSMNIPVLVVPGSITSPMSTGTNQLLVSAGAVAVTEAADVLKHLNIDVSAAKKQLGLDLMGSNDNETTILNAIADGSVTIGELQNTARLSTSQLQTTLTMLELEGRIMQDPGGLWQLG